MKKNLVYSTAMFVIIGVAINYLGSLIVKTFSLPLFFDSIGTVLGTVFGGFWAGALSGIIYNLITIFSSGQASSAIWLLSSIFIALVVWYLLRSKLMNFNSYFSVFKGGLVLALLNALLTSVITIFYFNGAESFQPAMNLQNLFATSIGSNSLAIFLAHFVIEIIDKTAVLLVAFSAYKILPINKRKLR